MKFRSTTPVVGIAVLMLALLLGGCGKDGTSAARSPDGAVSLTYPVKSDVDIAGSPTLRKAEQRGRIVIGVKEDQPYLAYKDPATGRYSGFDIEIAKMVAADLGFGPDRIEFVTVNPKDREIALASGRIDYYVSTYSITDKRKQQVSFAGPYYIAGQDLLIRKEETGVTDLASLSGRRVCASKGSTAVSNIKELNPQAQLVEYDSYSQCVTDLLNGQVDVVTTDDAILAGYAAHDRARLEVIGKPFTKELYGIGVPKDDKALQAAINSAIEAHERNGDWKRAYEATLGQSGRPIIRPPAIAPQ
jgi:glutamate transport system substrate-binding protein